MPVLLLQATAGMLCAQTVTTSPPEVDAMRLSAPPPLLSFVSPDASLVARPADNHSADLLSAPPVGFHIEAARDSNGPAATAFPASAQNIFVRWRGENLPRFAKIRLAWVAEDVGDLVEPNFVIDETRVLAETPTFGGRFTLSRPRDGWAPGKYRVDLYFDEELKDTLGVTISE